MIESMPTERFDNPEDADVVADAAEEFEPDAPADPEEPETLVDETDAGQTDPGEADAADVAEQDAQVVDDEDDYGRGE